MKMTAAQLASSVVPAKPFIPAKYASLRTEAVHALRAAVEAFVAADDRALGRAMADGQRVLRDLDAIWPGGSV